MARVEVEGLTRVVDGERILDGVGFEVDDGEFVMVIGASGSGKTSVLRAIAGLDEVTAGSLRFDGADVTTTPTTERDVGMISQHNTLFPNHRVRSNLMLPLLNRLIGRNEANKRVEAESRAHDITHILERWPATLSGGEQQLAQIARALVRVPRVLLMDEPLARLDPAIRRRLRHEIGELQRGYGVTTIAASNRSEEILSMPDRLVALDRGRVVQVGPPLEVRRRPETSAIADLTGPVSRLDVTVEAADSGYWITGDGIRLRAWPPRLERRVGRRCRLVIRPEDVEIAPSGPIEMRVHAQTWVESQPATELRSGAGSLLTHASVGAVGDRVRVMPTRWQLHDGQGRRLVSMPD